MRRALPLARLWQKQRAWALVLIVGISCQLQAAPQVSSGFAEVPITSKGGASSPAWRTVPLPPGGWPTTEGCWPPEEAPGPPAGHRVLVAIAIDKPPITLARPGPAKGLETASIAGDGGRVYLNPGPLAGMEQSHRLGRQSLAQRPSK